MMILQVMRKLILDGKRFGKLLVIKEFFDERKKKESRWECLCDCSNKTIATGWHLNAGKVNSCGCMYLKNDRTGHIYGYWKVLEYAGNERWKCECKCGTIKNVSTSSFHKNRSTSCGCPKPITDEEYKQERKEFILKNITKKRNGCWDWNLYKSDRGYGTIVFRGKAGQRINRIVWILWKGEIPKDYFVCHSCDRPQCCNPDHLWLGTHDDNMRDMALKGRSCKGEKSHLHSKNRNKKNGTKFTR